MIESDSTALHTLVADMEEAAPAIHCLRDPTRGGLATTLNELARQSRVGMTLRETEMLPEEKAFEIEQGYGMPVLMSEDGIEGPRAFLEKRKPAWLESKK